MWILQSSNGTEKILEAILKLLSSSGFFYFLERKKVEWNVGLIKAVRTSPSLKTHNKLNHRSERGKPSRRNATIM